MAESRDSSRCVTIGAFRSSVETSKCLATSDCFFVFKDEKGAGGVLRWQVAMFACLGYIVPEYYRWPGDLSPSLGLKFSDARREGLEEFVLV